MKTNILDVTLRDGGYEVDFQFSRTDVRKVGHALEDAGVKYIEIGHGQGLNASNPTNGLALRTDLEYMSAAQEALTTSHFGFFCIPTFARISDLDLLKDNGGYFVRVGANANKSSILETLPFIEHAREIGLKVFANYMKTYVAAPKEFEELASLSISAGAQCLSIVDSAGCMMPKDIDVYYHIIKSIDPDIEVGFHGHDNLGYAVYNTVHAAEIGCDFIDTSLQSLGRGAGNASTEQVMAVLQKEFGNQDYRLPELMRFSEEYLRHRVKFKGISGLDTYCGIAGFHSGYMNAIRRCADQYEISPYELIVEYCKEDRVGMDEMRLEEIAKEILNRHA